MIGSKSPLIGHEEDQVQADVHRAGEASYARSSVNPAAEKSPSKAKASVVRSSRIVAKLVASTHENSLSSLRRSHCSAALSAGSEIRMISTRGEALTVSRNLTAAVWPARRRRNVQVSPRTSLVVTSLSPA